MLILLSPSKTLNEEPVETSQSSICDFLEETKRLLPYLKKLSVKKLMSLMDISEKLAELNHQRFQNFVLPENQDQGKPAIYCFEGDVYQNMSPQIWDKTQTMYAQNSLRILSGLYGMLRPYDQISAYRLEMGSGLKTTRGKNLYEFWGDRITNKLNEEIKLLKHDLVINLASIEYSSLVNPKKLNANWIQVDFKEIRDGQPKTIALNSKRARGMMAQYLIMNQAQSIEDLKSFTQNGYIFHESSSKPNHLIFIVASIG